MSMTKRFLMLVSALSLTTAMPVLAQTPEASPSPAPAPVVAPEGMTNEEAAREELRKGIELNKQGYTESAIVSLRRAIELDPNLVEAYSELGTILLQSRNTAFAITIYSKLAELEPQKPEWKEILLELQTTYDQPRAAAITAEELLVLRPDDQVVMRKLADLYVVNGLNLESARMLERLGNAKGTDSKVYSESAKLYLDAGRSGDAVRVLKKAASLEPSNLEVQTRLAEAYTRDGQFGEAEDLIKQLQGTNPEAAGLRDKLVDVYVARGDYALNREGYMAAADWYREAQTLVPAESGTYKSLGERITNAEERRGVFFDNWYEYQDFNRNFSNRVINRLSIPITSSDLYVQLWHDYRTVATGVPGIGDAEQTYGKLGLEYRDPNNNMLYNGWYGTSGTFRLGGRYDSDSIQGGLWLTRDVNYDTPFALGNELKYFGQEGFLYGDITDRFGIGGNFFHGSYIDGSDQFIYNVGPYYSIAKDPDNYDWQISYTHGANINSPQQNPLTRFGPANFQGDTIGTRFTHTPTDRWRYYLGVYQSFFNDGTNGQTYNIGTDYRFSETSFFRIDYEYGAAPFGNLPITGGFLNNDNQSLRTQVHIQF